MWGGSKNRVLPAAADFMRISTTDIKHSVLNFFSQLKWANSKILAKGKLRWMNRERCNLLLLKTYSSTLCKLAINRFTYIWNILSQHASLACMFIVRNRQSVIPLSEKKAIWGTSFSVLMRNLYQIT